MARHSDLVNILLGFQVCCDWIPSSKNGGKYVISASKPSLICTTENIPANINQFMYAGMNQFLTQIYVFATQIYVAISYFLESGILELKYNTNQYYQLFASTSLPSSQTFISD